MTTESEARDRITLAREKRLNYASELKAASELNRLMKTTDQDALASAALVALEAMQDRAGQDRAGQATRGHQGGHAGQDSAALVALAWSNARQAKGNQTRAEMSRSAREEHFVTGSCFVTDDPFHLGMVLSAWTHLAVPSCQRVPNASIMSAIADCDASIPSRRKWSIAAILTGLAERPACGHFSLKVPAWAKKHEDGSIEWIEQGPPDPLVHDIAPTCGYCAVVAALDADGQIDRPDHDPAGCHRPGCRRCEAIRQDMRPALVWSSVDGLWSSVEANAGQQDRTPALVGPLARADAKDPRRSKRPTREDRAPRERTTRTSTQILRESSLLSNMDKWRKHYADEHNQDGSVPADEVPMSVEIATMALIPASGPNRERVAWAEAAAEWGIRDLRAFQDEVLGWVGARGHGEITKMARTAQVAADRLAVAITDKADGPSWDADRLARLASRADGRARLASRPAVLAEQAWRESDKAAHLSRKVQNAIWESIRAYYAPELDSARATFRNIRK